MATKVKLSKRDEKLISKLDLGAGPETVKILSVVIAVS